MYLVDTSVWIDAQSPRPRAKGRRLQELERSGAAYGLTGGILQEILQGVRDEISFRKTRARFSGLRIYHPLDEVETHAAAALLYARCRWRGLTPRSSNDCLIAQIAIDHDLTLLHDDADYEKIARVEPRLKLA